MAREWSERGLKATAKTVRSKGVLDEPLYLSVFNHT